MNTYPPVFRNNNMMLRAKIEKDGTITGVEVTNYSGGGSYLIWLYRAVDEELYWVIDLGWRTLFFEWAIADHCDRNDLDEMGREILRLARVDGALEERDANIRRKIQEKTGQIIPLELRRRTPSKAAEPSSI